MTRVTNIELANGWRLAPAVNEGEQVSIRQFAAPWWFRTEFAFDSRLADGDWMSYSVPVEVDGKVEVRVTTDDGKRKGRSLTVDYARIHGSLN